MDLSRRTLLAGAAAGAALSLAPSAFAQHPGLRLGVQNAPPEGFPDRAMRLVHGRAPAGLAGDLYRNGPGWFRYAQSQVGHWFDGDGFVQRFAIADGQVRHRARFVDTPKRRAEWEAQQILMPGFGTVGAPNARVETPDDLNAANTSVLMAGDAMWALWEGGSPVALDAETLETRGIQTLRDDLAHMPFTAHPKVEPNGRVWNIGVYRDRAIVWRLAPGGALEDAQVIELGQRSYVHDWAVTERKLIIPLQPWLHERMVAPLNRGYAWHGDMPFRVLVVDKDNLANRRIYELPAMFFFHTGDAWEDADGTIRIDICISANADFAVDGASAIVDSRSPQSQAELALMTLRPGGRAELARSGAFGDFPQTDRRRQGLRRDLVVTAGEDDAGAGLLNLTDWSTGAHQRFNFGADHIVEEHLMVPKPDGGGERDAWLVGLTLNARARATELHVFDVARLADGPVATWRSRHGVSPLGFHGTWRPA